MLGLIPLSVQHRHQPPAKVQQLPPLEQRRAVRLTAHKVRRAVHLDPEPLAAAIHHEVEAVALVQHHLLLQAQPKLGYRRTHLPLQARRLPLCAGKGGAAPLQQSVAGKPIGAAALNGVPKPTLVELTDISERVLLRQLLAAAGAQLVKQPRRICGAIGRCERQRGVGEVLRVKLAHARRRLLRVGVEQRGRRAAGSRGRPCRVGEV